MAPPGIVTDVTVENHGSLFLFRPHTPHADNWIDIWLDPDAQRIGGAVVVEHRYALDTAGMMLADGLVVA